MDMDALVESIHASGYKACIAVTGGGSGAVHALLSHPGASRFVLEVQIPYTQRAMFDYLGETIESACSAETARTMAGRAFERAVVFTLTEPVKIPILGIACTAALQTTRERRGEDRAHIHIKSRDNELARKIEFQSSDRKRQEEELGRALLESIAQFVGVVG